MLRYKQGKPDLTIVSVKALIKTRSMIASKEIKLLLLSSLFIKFWGHLIPEQDWAACI